MRHPVVIVGGGPVGLALAVDLGGRGVPCVVVDGKAAFGEGSRGLCYAKRTLEILDRLGVGERAVAKGVTWQLGKVFHGTELLYQFNLLPEGGHKMPAFINLQQYYIEQYLYERCQELPDVDLRFQNKCVGVETFPDHARIDLETPDGAYAIEADWLIACDGSRSTVRAAHGPVVRGPGVRGPVPDRRHQDARGLPGRALVLVRPTVQPGPVGPAAQAARRHLAHRPAARLGRRPGRGKEARARPAAPGGDARQRPQVRVRVDQHLHLPVPAAGALRPRAGALRRGRRAPGLALRRARLQQRRAGHRQPRLEARGRAGGAGAAALLATYGLEREAAADENLLNSTRSTDFITPKSRASCTIRDAALSLAAETPFARTLVNSGRLSTPSVYDTPLSTPDAEPFAGTARLGAPLPDAPMVGADGRPAWLLDRLGPRFTLLYCGAELPCQLPGTMRLVRIGHDVTDAEGLFQQRYDARPGSAWLVRPDQHLAARFRRLDHGALAAATQRALGWELRT